MFLRERSLGVGRRASAGEATNCVASLILMGLAVMAPPALAQTPGRSVATDPTPAASAPAAKGPHEHARHLSKFEARHIRHSCQGRANEKGLSGGEREGFLAKCYFSRVSHRGVRRECQLQAAAKGIDKSAVRDYVRECVKERSHRSE